MPSPSKYHTDKLRREIKTKGKITVYKCLGKNKKTLISPFFCHKWEIGENVSDFSSNLAEAHTNVYHGFHVYLDRKVAKESLYQHSEVIVKFTAKAEDLIAASKPHTELTINCEKYNVQEAVFSKLTLHKSTVEKIFSKKI